MENQNFHMFFPRKVACFPRNCRIHHIRNMVYCDADVTWHCCPAYLAHWLNMNDYRLTSLYLVSCNLYTIPFRSGIGLLPLKFLALAGSVTIQDYGGVTKPMTIEFWNREKQNTRIVWVVCKTFSRFKN